MSNFNKCFDKLILIEGGYVNDPCDAGGKTKYGITESTARAHGYRGDMRDLPLETAKAIYRKSYWDSIRLDEIISPLIQEELFDTGVNCGTSTAIKFIQKAYNLLVEGSPLVVDGRIGKNTINAINSYKQSERLYKVANAYQAKYYIEIAENNPKNEKFIYGWLKNRVTI